MQELEILFYEKPDGTEPAKDFLLKLDIKMRAKRYRSDYLSRKEKRDV